MIPAKTPVLVECVSDDVKDNLVTPVINSTATPADNAAQLVFTSAWVIEWSGSLQLRQI